MAGEVELAWYNGNQKETPKGMQLEPGGQAAGVRLQVTTKVSISTHCTGPWAFVLLAADTKTHIGYHTDPRLVLLLIQLGWEP